MVVRHKLEPIYTENSRVLILGSMPSVKSREVNFYYGHPQNRFWKVLADVFAEDEFLTNEEKKDFLVRNDIALWDVIESCDILGSSDSSIKNVVPNDIIGLIRKTKISKVFVTGRKAEFYYNKFCLKGTNIPCEYLPSTSPANAAISYEYIKKAFRRLVDCLNE